MRTKSERFFGTYEDMCTRFDNVNLEIAFTSDTLARQRKVVTYSRLNDIPDVDKTEKGFIQFTPLWYIHPANYALKGRIYTRDDGVEDFELYSDQGVVPGIFFRACTQYHDSCLLYGEISTTVYDDHPTKVIYDEIAKKLFVKCTRVKGYKIMPGALDANKIHGIRLSMSCPGNPQFSDIKIE